MKIWKGLRVDMSLRTSEPPVLEENEKECRVTNGLLTERVKDRECQKQWRVRV